MSHNALVQLHIDRGSGSKGSISDAQNTPGKRGAGALQEPGSAPYSPMRADRRELKGGSRGAIGLKKSSTPGAVPLSLGRGAMPSVLSTDHTVANQVATGLGASTSALFSTAGSGREGSNQDGLFPIHAAPSGVCNSNNAVGTVPAPPQPRSNCADDNNWVQSPDDSMLSATSINRSRLPTPISGSRATISLIQPTGAPASTSSVTASESSQCSDRPRVADNDAQYKSGQLDVPVAKSRDPHTLANAKSASQSERLTARSHETQKNQAQRSHQGDDGNAVTHGNIFRSPRLAPLPSVPSRNGGTTPSVIPLPLPPSPIDALLDTQSSLESDNTTVMTCQVPVGNNNFLMPSMATHTGPGSSCSSIPVETRSNYSSQPPNNPYTSATRPGSHNGDMERGNEMRGSPKHYYAIATSNLVSNANQSLGSASLTHVSVGSLNSGVLESKVSNDKNSSSNDSKEKDGAHQLLSKMHATTGSINHQDWRTPVGTTPQLMGSYTSLCSSICIGLNASLASPETADDPSSASAKRVLQQAAADGELANQRARRVSGTSRGKMVRPAGRQGKKMSNVSASSTAAAAGSRLVSPSLSGQGPYKVIPYDMQDKRQERGREKRNPQRALLTTTGGGKTKPSLPALDLTRTLNIASDLSRDESAEDQPNTATPEGSGRRKGSPSLPPISPGAYGERTERGKNTERDTGPGSPMPRAAKETYTAATALYSLPHPLASIAAQRRIAGPTPFERMPSPTEPPLPHGQLVAQRTAAYSQQQQLQYHQHVQMMMQAEGTARSRHPISPGSTCITMGENAYSHISENEVSNIRITPTGRRTNCSSLAVSASNSTTAPPEHSGGSSHENVVFVGLIPQAPASSALNTSGGGQFLSVGAGLMGRRGSTMSLNRSLSSRGDTFPAVSSRRGSYRIQRVPSRHALPSSNNSLGPAVAEQQPRQRQQRQYYYNNSRYQAGLAVGAGSYGIKATGPGEAGGRQSRLSPGPPGLTSPHLNQEEKDMMLFLGAAEDKDFSPMEVLESSNNNGSVKADTAPSTISNDKSLESKPSAGAPDTILSPKIVNLNERPGFVIEHRLQTVVPQSSPASGECPLDHEGSILSISSNSPSVKPLPSNGSVTIMSRLHSLQSRRISAGTVIKNCLGSPEQADLGTHHMPGFGVSTASEAALSRGSSIRTESDWAGASGSGSTVLEKASAAAVAAASAASNRQKADETSTPGRWFGRPSGNPKESASGSFMSGTLHNNSGSHRKLSNLIHESGTSSNSFGRNSSGSPTIGLIGSTLVPLAGKGSGITRTTSATDDTPSNPALKGGVSKGLSAHRVVSSSHRQKLSDSINSLEGCSASVNLMKNLARGHSHTDSRCHGAPETNIAEEGDSEGFFEDNFDEYSANNTSYEDKGLANRAFPSIASPVIPAGSPVGAGKRFMSIRRGNQMLSTISVSSVSSLLGESDTGNDSTATPGGGQGINIYSLPLEQKLKLLADFEKRHKEKERRRRHKHRARAKRRKEKDASFRAESIKITEETNSTMALLNTTETVGNKQGRIASKATPSISRKHSSYLRRHSIVSISSFDSASAGALSGNSNEEKESDNPKLSASYTDVIFIQVDDEEFAYYIDTNDMQGSGSHHNPSQKAGKPAPSVADCRLFLAPPCPTRKCSTFTATSAADAGGGMPRGPSRRHTIALSGAAAAEVVARQRQMQQQRLNEYNHLSFCGKLAKYGPITLLKAWCSSGNSPPNAPNAADNPATKASVSPSAHSSVVHEALPPPAFQGPRTVATLLTNVTPQEAHDALVIERRQQRQSIVPSSHTPSPSALPLERSGSVSLHEGANRVEEDINPSTSFLQHNLDAFCMLADGDEPEAMGEEEMAMLNAEAAAQQEQLSLATGGLLSFPTSLVRRSLGPVRSIVPTVGAMTSTQSALMDLSPYSSTATPSANQGELDVTPPQATRLADDPALISSAIYQPTSYDDDGDTQLCELEFYNADD